VAFLVVCVLYVVDLRGQALLRLSQLLIQVLPLLITLHVVQVVLLLVQLHQQAQAQLTKL
jgi:hypothetical protein